MGMGIKRETFTVPPGFEAERTSDGRATGRVIGPSTYLHAGSAQGWPHDHSMEDTFDIPHELPMITVDTRAEREDADQEYYADYGPKGEALLKLTVTTYTNTTLATFDTFADAETAAKALNELKGY